MEIPEKGQTKDESETQLQPKIVAKYYSILWVLGIAGGSATGFFPDSGFAGMVTTGTYIAMFLLLVGIFACFWTEKMVGNRILFIILFIAHLIVMYLPLVVPQSIKEDLLRHRVKTTGFITKREYFAGKTGSSARYKSCVEFESTEKKKYEVLIDIDCGASQKAVTFEYAKSWPRFVTSATCK